MAVTCAAALVLSRTFHLSSRNFASGGLTKNDHTSSLTTNFYNSVIPGRDFNSGENVEDIPPPTEWFSTTPYAILLVDHDGNYSEWRTNQGGLPGGTTQFTVPPHYECSISMAHLGSSDVLDDGVTFGPPKSSFDLSTTTFMIENDLELGEQSFYVNAPSYLEYYLPACPNWTPDDCDGGSCGSGESADCPKREMHAGEFKLTVVGLMSGTDINSLATGDDAPEGASTKALTCPQAEGKPCEDEIDRDIAQYKTLVYRTMLDVGSMGEDVLLWLTDAEGTQTELSDVSPDMNIASYVLHIQGATTSGMTYSFVPYYSMGVTSRDLASDQLCELDHDGDRFADCNRDVTGFAEPPDSMPPSDYNGMNNFAKAGDESMTSDEIRRLAAAPVLDVTEVLPALITIRPAMCHGRPESPEPLGGAPWPDAPADCPSWYLEVSYDNSCVYEDGWTGEKTTKDAPCWIRFKMDTYTECESGYCYFIDVHIGLGGKDADSRTAFGNPANAANGYDKGTFFVYDPQVSVERDGTSWTQAQLLTIILPAVGGVLLLVGATLYYRRYCKSKGAKPKAADP